MPDPQGGKTYVVHVKGIKPFNVNAASIEANAHVIALRDPDGILVACYALAEAVGVTERKALSE